MLFLFILVAGLGIYAFEKWMENIEAQVTMNFKSAEYNLSLVADKKKKRTVFDMMRVKKSSKNDAANDESKESAVPSEQ